MNSYYCCKFVLLFSLSFAIVSASIQQLKLTNQIILDCENGDAIESYKFHNAENLLVVFLKCTNRSRIVLVDYILREFKEAQLSSSFSVNDVYVNDKQNKIFITDGSSMLHVIDADAKINSRRLDFEPKSLVFCERTGFIVSMHQHDLWVTLNNGLLWRRVDTDVSGVPKLYAFKNETLVYYLKNKQFYNLEITAALDSKPVLLLDNTTDFSVVDSHVFVVQQTAKQQYLYVSVNNSKLEIAYIEDLKSMHVLEYKPLRVSNNQVFLLIVSQLESGKTVSNLYVSKPNSFEFTLSLENIVSRSERTKHLFSRNFSFSSISFTDFYSAPGIDGVHFVNTFTWNDESPVVTFATKDNGREWKRLSQNLHVEDSISLSFGSYSLFTERTATSSIASRDTLPGFFVATKVDGGIVASEFDWNWRTVLKNSHEYALSKFGLFLVAARNDAPTKELLYSTNYGKTFEALEFAANEDFIVENIFPSSDESKFIITVTNSSKADASLGLIQIDLSSLVSGSCSSLNCTSVFTVKDCVLGERTLYRKRVCATRCYMDDSWKITREPCECTKKDLVCELGDDNERCENSPEDCGVYWQRRSGFKKLENSRCSTPVLPEKRELISCKIKSSRFLIYSTDTSLFKYDLQSDHEEVLLLNVNPNAFDYDMESDCLFWFDAKSSAIKSKCSQVESTLISKDLGDVVDLRVDWINKNIYWVDTKRSTIEISNMSGTKRKVVLLNTNTRGLVVDAVWSYVYWIEEDDQQSFVMQSRLDGTSPVRLSKAIDGVELTNFEISSNKFVYWMNKNGVVETLSLANDSTSHMYTNLMPGFKLFLIDGDSLTYAYNSIEEELYTSENHDAYRPFIHKSGLRKLRLFHRGVQTYGENNVCAYSSNHNCSQICTSLPKRGYSCLCSGPGDKCVEQAVSLECNQEKFSCMSGECASKTVVCNGKKDCKDGSDEFDCSASLNKFRCLNGRLISKSLLCNSADDCSDEDLSPTGRSSDESCQENAQSSTTTTTIIIQTTTATTTKTTSKAKYCDKTKYFECKPIHGDIKCLKNDNICNGVKDCFDGRDERNCTQCSEGAFLCKKQRICLHPEKQCDGNYDCDEDELECDSMSMTVTQSSTKKIETTTVVDTSALVDSASTKSIAFTILLALVFILFTLIVIVFYINARRKRFKQTSNYFTLDYLNTTSTNDLSTSRSSLLNPTSASYPENEPLIY